MCTGAELMLVAAAVSAGGTVLGGIQQKNAAEANAQIADNQAAYAEDAAKVQAEKIRRAGKKQVGAANAALAASGVKIGEGTALEITKTITRDAEEDALTEILNGKRIATSSRDEAGMLRVAGDNAMTNSVLSAGSTVMGGWKTAAMKRGT